MDGVERIWRQMNGQAQPDGVVGGRTVTVCYSTPFGFHSMTLRKYLMEPLPESFQWHYAESDGRRLFASVFTSNPAVCLAGFGGPGHANRPYDYPPREPFRFFQGDEWKTSPTS